MGEIVGVHHKVLYRASFEEKEDRTLWNASFLHDGLELEVQGAIRNNLSTLPTIEAKLHITMQLYIEAALLRGDLASGEEG